MNSEHKPAFMAEWPEEAQRTVNELYNALWLALKASGGEIAVSHEELAEWGPTRGRVEWLSDPRGAKIIRLADEPGTGI